MTHPCEEIAAQRLAALRALPRPVMVEHEEHPVHQVYFSWDAERARVGIELLDHPGALAAVRVTIAGNPRWINLSVGLGTAGFAAGTTLALALKASSDREFVEAPFMRSRNAEGTRDSRFAETLALGPEPRTAVLLHQLGEGDPLVGPEQFHTLILPLPAESFTLILADLRFLVLDGAAHAGVPTLGSLAQ